MTPADLKVRREALGVSQTWLAERFGVQDRSVRRWEAGESEIPDDLEKMLISYEELTDNFVDEVIAMIEESTQAYGEPVGIDLNAFATDSSLWSVYPDFEPMPASWHRAVLARAMNATDIPVTFHFQRANLTQ